MDPPEAKRQKLEESESFHELQQQLQEVRQELEETNRSLLDTEALLESAFVYIGNILHLRNGINEWDTVPAKLRSCPTMAGVAIQSGKFGDFVWKQLPEDIRNSRHVILTCLKNVRKNGST